MFFSPGKHEKKSLVRYQSKLVWLNRCENTIQHVAHCIILDQVKKKKTINQASDIYDICDML